MKNAVLAAATAVLSWAFWANVRVWLDNPLDFSNVYSWLSPLVLFLITVSYLAVIFILGGSRIGSLHILLLALTFVAIFGYNLIYLAGIGLMFILQLAALRRFKIEIRERININIFKIAGRGATLIITSVLIMVSFSYFLTPAVQNSAKTGNLPPVLEKAIQTTAGIFLNNQFSGVNKQYKDEAKKQILTGVSAFILPYLKFMPPFLAFGMFIALQGLSFIFIWPVIFLSSFLFWIFKKIGIFRVEKIKIESEVLKF